jgi:L-ascorbate metabolism protein UlaG (beta-lactamase superfamily)
MSGLTAADHQIAIWALGLAGFMVRGAGQTLVFDPYLSDNLQLNSLGPRNFPPPCAPSSLSDVDLVFVTHDHGDHLDPDTLLPLLAASPTARVVAPPTSCTILREIGVGAERIIPARCDESMALGKVTVRTVPAAHYTWEANEQGQPRFVGYLITLAGLTVYHAGDTIIYDGMIERLRRQPIDVAILPINGRDWQREQAGLTGNLDSMESLYLTDAVGADLLIPCHYDLFPKNGVNPAYFVDCLYREYRQQRFKLLQPGECIIVGRSGEDRHRGG